jgi:hypothetical protein
VVLVLAINIASLLVTSGYLSLFHIITQLARLDLLPQVRIP